MSKASAPDPAKTIQSVSEAIDSLADDSLMRDIRPAASEKRGDASFGLWFRGHGKLGHTLTPGILRESLGQNQRYVDEVSLTRHFKALNPDALSRDASDFDWLVTMQHYLAPTRLLDWTENLLVALYFAVRSPELDGKEDAAVWILNARRLNYHASATTRAAELAFPEDPDVIARSCLCRVRQRPEWYDVFKRELQLMRFDRAAYRADRILDAIERVRVGGRSVNDLSRAPFDLKKFETPGTSAAPEPIVLNLYDREVGGTAQGVYARLRMPVAVYAARSNRRIRSQAGVFTLHGGKYVPNPGHYTEPRAYDTPIGMPISLQEIDAGLPRSRILKWLRIPKGRRAEMRRTLAQIGVTDATLFPELDYQSKYLLTRWTTFDALPEESE